MTAIAPAQADVAGLTQAQQGVVTSWSCCGQDLFQSTTTMEVQDCNFNPYGCVYGRQGPMWRFDMSEVPEGSQIHAAELTFTVGGYCTADEVDVNLKAISGTLSSGMVSGIVNSPDQSLTMSVNWSANTAISAAAVQSALEMGSLVVYMHLDDDVCLMGTDANLEIDSTPPPPVCTGDFNGDDMVGATDLLVLLAVWGDCDGCDQDISGDGMVGADDLLALLSAWGQCD
ncbi:MAG: hypothetical protein MK101_10710 [Phycisphaerales bacterium]|nr:hypothetical protein [Phycisphaerales bacterium]